MASQSFPITATRALFIKLGDGGKWEEECTKGGFARIGFDDVAHQDCLAGRWEAIRETYMNSDKPPSSATRWTNELKAFYTSGPETLWVTFHGGTMYWGFLTGQPTSPTGTHKERSVAGDWQNRDANGKKLSIRSISSKLTQVRGFRGTICRIDDLEYLLKKINGIEQPEVTAARLHREEFLGAIAKLISHLTPRDFEVLVDMIFAAGGWRRVGESGGTEPDIDLDLVQPVTGDRLLVQVKSHTNATVVAEVAANANARVTAERFYLVTHRHDGPPASGTGRLELFDPGRLAGLVLDAGLADWVIEKSS
jgi:hypothetical protein